MIQSIYKNENTGKSRGRYGNKEWYPRISDRKWRISTSQKSLTIDAAIVWNKASEIRTAKSLAMAKKAIRAHCKSLPI